MERMQSIAVIYVPLDGMNSEGLLVADMVADNNEGTHQQTGKTNLAMISEEIYAKIVNGNT